MFPKSLIIVCDDEEKEYAKFIMQLISLTDDEDGKIIGIEDGSVSATIYSTKQYRDSTATISSEQHVLFVGNNKEIKKSRPYIPEKYKKYGMEFGWLGKYAYIDVDKTLLEKKEYVEFIKYCEDYKQQLNLKKLHYNGKEGVQGGIGVAIGGAAVQMLLVFLGPIALPGIIGAGGAAIVGVVESAATLGMTKQVREQQFRAISAIFYIEGLKEFVEG